jgi:nicotinamidase-related amidase
MSVELPQARGRTALLIIDMINDLNFEEGDDLRAQAQAVAPVIVKLRDQAESAGVPVIFVNDNFSQWHSERSRIVEYVATTRGADIAALLSPTDDDFFVIKPEMSGFYATNLATLLPRLGVQRLILTGVAADICVLFTAADAHMRAYELWVPGDAVASDRPDHMDRALRILQKSMGAETRATSALSLDDWIKLDKESSHPERSS